MLKGEVNFEIGPSHFYVPTGRIQKGIQLYRDGVSNDPIETFYSSSSEWETPAICYARSWLEMLQSWQIDITQERTLEIVNRHGNPEHGWDDQAVVATAKEFGTFPVRYDLSELHDLEEFRKNLRGDRRCLTLIMEVGPDQVYDSTIQFEEHWVVLRTASHNTVVKIDPSERQMFPGGTTNGTSVIDEVDMIKMMNAYSLGGGKLNNNETRVSATDWSGPIAFILDRPKTRPLELRR